MKRLSTRLLFLLLLTSCLTTASLISAATYATTPTADAFVATGPIGNLSNNNYGGGGALAIAAPGLTNGEFQSVIKFNLTAALSSFNTQFGAGQWSIQSVSLQLVSSAHNNAIYNDIVPGLFGVSLMQNNSWVEGSGTAGIPATNGITFNTLQTIYINNSADQALGSFSFPGGTSGSNSYSLNLSSGLLADIFAGGDLTLRLFGDDNNVSYLFNSRNLPPAGQPQLIISVVPEPASLALFAVAAVMFLCAKRGRRLRPVRIAHTKAPRQI